jgi:hypothetical protein
MIWTLTRYYELDKMKEDEMAAHVALMVRKEKVKLSL